MSIDKKLESWYEDNPFKDVDDGAYVKFRTKNSVKLIEIKLGSGHEIRTYSIMKYPGYDDLDAETKKIAPYYLIINGEGDQEGAIALSLDSKENMIFEFRFDPMRITLKCVGKD